MEHGHSAFWDDLADDLEDPEALRHYIAEASRIATYNNLVNSFRDALAATGMTQGALADAIPANAAAVRRLLSRGHLNPTLSTLSAVASGLGYRLTLEPLPDRERKLVSRALLTGHTPDPRALIATMEAARAGTAAPPRRAKTAKTSAAATAAAAKALVKTAKTAAKTGTAVAPAAAKKNAGRVRAAVGQTDGAPGKTPRQPRVSA